MKESAPEVKSKEEDISGSIELQESIGRAKELRAELEVFNGADVVGSAELNKVEDLACALSVELAGISGALCVAEGLPFHPMDSKL